MRPRVLENLEVEIGEGALHDVVLKLVSARTPRLQSLGPDAGVRMTQSPLGECRWDRQRQMRLSLEGALTHGGIGLLGENRLNHRRCIDVPMGRIEPTPQTIAAERSHSGAPKATLKRANGSAEPADALPNPMAGVPGRAAHAAGGNASTHSRATIGERYGTPHR